jgi:hypothetical protein
MPLTQEEWAQLQQLAHQQNQQQMAHTHAQYQQHLANEEKKLLEQVPEWANDIEKARKDISTIKSFMIAEHNFTPESLAVVGDHRALLAMKSYYEAHERERGARRRAADEQVKRERTKKAEADRAAEKTSKLEAAKKVVHKHSLSSHHGAQALADALDEE